MSKSGEIIPDPCDMANELNNYFASVFTTENLSFLPQDSDYSTLAVQVLDDIAITADMVMNKLNRLRLDKAAGTDDISPRVLFEIRKEICYPLTVIFRKSLHLGEVPKDCRLANITPIYKKG